MPKQLTNQEFIKRCHLKHGERYDYSKVQYTGHLNLVIINCSIHGDFLQRPKVHLRGHGCQKCGDSVWVASSLTEGNREVNAENFLKKALKTHKGLYTYNNMEYVTTYQPVTITCQVHGDFKQLVGNHLAGKGCPQCANHGFDGKKPAILYYLKVNIAGHIYYKIGITNNSVKKRFRVAELQCITTIFEEYFEVGADARRHEKEILLEFKGFLYKGPPLLHAGNTEIFTKDVLKKKGRPPLRP